MRAGHTSLNKELWVFVKPGMDPCVADEQSIIFLKHYACLAESKWLYSIAGGKSTVGSVPPPVPFKLQTHRKAVYVQLVRAKYVLNREYKYV